MGDCGFKDPKALFSMCTSLDMHLRTYKLMDKRDQALSPQLSALRLSVLPAAVHVFCFYTAFAPEATSRKNANVLRRGVLAFTFLRVEYLSLFAHIVSFSHVASET
tara:strand:+ start:96 stop:413 length:318 start_codon:yes stop_codon:yes gene_type:complete